MHWRASDTSIIIIMKVNSEIVPKQYYTIISTQSGTDLNIFTIQLEGVKKNKALSCVPHIHSIYPSYSRKNTF